MRIIPPPKTIVFSFLVDRELMYKFRIQAVKRKMSAGKLIRKLIESYVNNL